MIIRNHVEGNHAEDGLVFLACKMLTLMLALDSPLTSIGTGLSAFIAKDKLSRFLYACVVPFDGELIKSLVSLVESKFPGEHTEQV